MGNSAIAALMQGLVYISIVLLYVLVSLVTYRRLFPRLSTTARRLASIMLAAQSVVIAVSLAGQPTSSFAQWLWCLDQEWNIPTTLATTQLALVAGAALLTAWLAGARPAWQRLYFVGVGLVFLFFAIDEYFKLHEANPYWRTQYAALGAGIVLVTLAVALRSQVTLRQTRAWHACLLFGLAIGGFGATSLEMHLVECSGWGYFLFSGECIEIYVLEESLEFLGIWLTLVAMLGHFSHVSPAPPLRVRLALYSWPMIWIALLIPNANIPPISQQIITEGAAVAFEKDVHLHGFRIDRDRRNSYLHLHLYLSVGGLDFDGQGYSINLVDQASLAFIAGRDTYAHNRLDFDIGPDFQPVFRQWLEVEIPPDTPTNRALWIVLTLWRKEDNIFVSQDVLASDLQVLGDSQVILGELVMPAPAAVQSSTAPLALFEGGLALYAATLPQRALAGETLSITFSWRSDATGHEDYVQFLHLGHKRTGEWLVFDKHPLGARLPTRLWYNGLYDSEIWQVPLPDYLAAGSYAVFSGLYRVRDSERVKARGADGSPNLDSRVPLGSLMVQNAP